MTKYTVTINETKRTITVDLDGYKGKAKCCPTDLFDIKVGTELALERAKVAKKNATTKPATKKIDLMEAVRLVETMLPKGGCVVIGNGKELTKQNKDWLRTLIGDKPCDCECISKEALKDALEDAYDDGYDEGYCDGSDAGHDKGYDEGYRDGYGDGHKETIADILDIIGNID